MFNNQTEDKTDFCEEYKSQILNNVTQEKSSSLGTVLKILTILLLLAVIVALSIYGYNYFINKSSEEVSAQTPPMSIQISDEDLKVIDESSEEESIEVQEPIKEETNLPHVPVVVKESSVSKEPTVTLSDIDKLANDVQKVVLANREKKSVVKEKNITQEEHLKVPVPNTPESKYLEDLADLSKELDKEKKNK